MQGTRPQGQPAAIRLHTRSCTNPSGYALETRRARTARDASNAASWSDHGLAGVATSPTRRNRRIAARTTSTRSLPVTTMLRPTVRAGRRPLSRPSSSLARARPAGVAPTSVRSAAGATAPRRRPGAVDLARALDAAGIGDSRRARATSSAHDRGEREHAHRQGRGSRRSGPRIPAPQRSGRRHDAQRR